jgi:hypothetical protein
MKKILLFAICSLSIVSMDAQLIWRVSGRDVKRDSFIFGTHHVAPVSMLDSVSGLREAINACDTVYGEVRDDELLSADIQQTMMSMMLAPEDSVLTRLLTKSQADSINAVLARYTGGVLTVDQMSALKPAAVAAQLALLQSMVAFPDYDPSQQIDMAVQRVAKELGKPIRGFETALWQAELLYGTSISEQLIELMQAIDKDGYAADYSRRLAEAYMHRNLDAISAIVTDAEIGITDSEMNRMVYDRNNAWIKVLIGLLPVSSIFVCVGVGHLPGERGLIELLRKAGFDVTPID